MIVVHMLGGVCLRAERCCGEGHDGEWEMGKQSRFGTTLGCLAWSSRESYPQSLKVFKKLIDCLINPTSRSWDTDLLAGVFALVEADLIQKIPLSPVTVEDKLIWPYVSSGVYSVKSGYRFLVKEKGGSRASLQTQTDSPSVWRWIWGLSVSNKGKNFLWRACKEALPVKINLVRRKVLSEDICCHCNLKAEDGLHALWDCAKLSTIWEVDSLWLFCRSKKFSNFYELASFVMENSRNPELFVVLAWTIWTRRNQLRTSSKPFPLMQVIPSATQLIQDFTQAQPTIPTVMTRTQRQPAKWEPPTPPLLKINFDGAVFKEKGEAGIGVVVRDSHGMVIASLTEKIQLPSSSDEVEALAAVRAMTLAMDLNLPSFIVKGDSEVVISALRKEEESFSSFGHLISSIKHYLHSCFCISFSHTRRSGNSVAHSLAKFAKYIVDLSVWMEDVPPQVNDVLVADHG